eukprot:4186759-Pyramimonas_sp.AAC.1
MLGAHGREGARKRRQLRPAKSNHLRRPLNWATLLREAPNIKTTKLKFRRVASNRSRPAVE